MKFVPRQVEPRLRRLLRSFPAVFIHGPRQCGKTRLVRELFPDWEHLDLERTTDIEILRADLEGFFSDHPRRVVIDEAQRLPELFPALRHVIDRSQAKGRFLLLGSAGPTLLRSVSESLAGRVGVLELTPLRAMELAGSRRLKEHWFWGGYPPVLTLRGQRERLEWIESYVVTFLERDLPALGFSMAPGRLRRLWTMLTHVHGHLLNSSDLGRSLEVSSPTVGRYLDILEGAFMIRRLPPHFANIQKRLTKSPKLYVRDSGLLHFLAGLRSPGDLQTWDRRGQSFEGMVIEELIHLATNKYVRPHIAFWRTRAGAEVDLLLGNGPHLLPIEIKLSRTIDHHSLIGLRGCMQDLGLKRGWVITKGRERRKIGGGVEIVPWSEIVSGSIDLPLGGRS